MFRILARFVYRSPWMCISLWVGLAVLTGLLAPTAEELQLSEPASLLPDQAPSNTAMRVYAEAFPEQTARSRIVLVFERTSGLTAKDRQYLVSLSRELESEGRTGRETWRVWSASIRPELGIRLNSSDGQATMIVIGLDVNFVTQRAAAIVDQVEAQARSELPPGLTLETTGSAAIGREHNSQAGAALARTTRVTILAVLIILAFVYRSPLGALVPLASIGLSVFIAFRVLDFLALAGWSISGAERTFTVVLLFGAGTNYTLFWISRYREALSRGIDGAAATMEAMTRVGPTILASAGTTIFGLMMLMSADMIIIHNSGKVLGLVLCVALLSAITLAPAMITVMGRAFFWPGSPADHLSVGQRYVWPRLAKDLVRRPYGVFFCGLLVVSLPAVASFWTPLRYDTLGVVPQDTTAERGLAMLNAHFWEEEIFSTRLLIESSDFESDRQRLKVLSDDLAARLTEVEDVSDVWHMGAPAGRRRGSGLASLLTSPLLSEQVTKYYYAQRQNVLQMEVMQRHPPWSPEAVAVLARLQQTTHEWASQNLKSGYNLYALGQTPYIQDVKNIADGDLSRVVWLVTGVIWIIVLAVIRRVYLTIFMLAATLLSFAAAFGLTGWIFVDLLGGGGVDYKVQILLFVIIVAVGQDYNIFLVQRMLEELKSFELDEAITRSVILTGPIISSCGLIMAATLGSLATTRVALTRQMGFACAAGILIDTFLVRPLLIPSFYLILERLGSRRHGPAKENSEPKVPARPE